MPYAAVNDIQATLAHEHVLARGMVQTVNHPTCGEIKLVGAPVKYSGWETGVRSAPPTLGEHTNEVLKGLGFGKEEIEGLRRGGVVA